MSERAPKVRDGFFFRTLIVVLVVIGCVANIPAFLTALSGNRRSPAMRIVNNLITIDIAKRQWAEDPRATNSTSVSPEALVSHFSAQRKPGQLVSPVVGERYFINKVGVAPEAQLTRRLGKWPVGTIIRLHPGANPIYEVVLPNEQGGANPDSASGFSSETNSTSAAAASRRSP